MGFSKNPMVNDGHAGTIADLMTLQHLIGIQYPIRRTLHHIWRAPPSFPRSTWSMPTTRYLSKKATLPNLPSSLLLVYLSFAACLLGCEIRRKPSSALLIISAAISILCSYTLMISWSPVVYMRNISNISEPSFSN